MIGVMITSMTIATAAPLPNRPPGKDSWYIVNAITRLDVPGPPFVMTNTRSNSLMTLTARVTARTEIGRLTIGRMIRRKTWNSFAPSTRDASITSDEMLLIAADRMTVANPVDPQIPTAITAALTKPGSPSHEIGPMW